MSISRVVKRCDGPYRDCRRTMEAKVKTAAPSAIIWVLCMLGILSDIPGTGHNTIHRDSPQSTVTAVTQNLPKRRVHN